MKQTPFIQLSDDEWLEIAHAAFDAYGDDAEWKTFDGREIPNFGEISPEVRAHWVEAVKAVAVHFRIRPLDGEK